MLRNGGDMRRRIGSILVLALLAATFTVTPWRPDAANAISTSFADGTFQDFDAGTNQDVAIDNDGLTLGPDSSTFNEGSLPAGWTFTSTSQSQPGYASVANGKLTVSGGVARSGIYLRPGQSLTFQATFGLSLIHI